MLKIDALLNTDQLKIKTVGKPANGGILSKFLIGATVVLVAGSAGLFIENIKSSDVKTVEVNSPSVISSIKQSVNNIIKKETSFPIYENSSLVNSKNKEILNKVGNFELKEGLANNQIARTVSQLKFAEKDYFLSLVSEGEGFRPHFYNDNIGYAFGNGWNVSLQNATYNTEIAKAISQDKVFVSKITSVSGKFSDKKISNEYSSVNIEPQRAMQVARIMGEKFEEGVINGISRHMKNNSIAVNIHKTTQKPYKQIASEMYNSLAHNEKDAVLYHAYKVGEGGFVKYNNLLKNLISYGLSDNKTDQMRKTIADGFTYKYKMNRMVLEDTRASVLVGSMFASQEAFGYLVGKNVAPQNMKKLTTALEKNNIDGSAQPGVVYIPDPVGVNRQRLESEGGNIKIELMNATNVSANIENIRKSNTTKKFVPYGFM